MSSAQSVETTRRVCIVGAGVCGLSVAWHIKRLLGEAVSVVIISDKFLNQTTSFVAGNDKHALYGNRGECVVARHDMHTLLYELCILPYKWMCIVHDIFLSSHRWAMGTSSS